MAQGQAAAHARASGFEAFVRACADSLTASAFLLTGDHDLAEDLVQEALARTWRAWRRLDRSGEAEAFARQAMYRVHTGRRFRGRVAEVPVEVVPERGGEDPDTALRVAVHAALLSLPAVQRAAVVLRYFEDRTEADAAEVLGCPVSALRARARRGLKGLRRRFPDLGLAGAEESGSDRPALTWKGEAHA